MEKERGGKERREERGEGERRRGEEKERGGKERREERGDERIRRGGKERREERGEGERRREEERREEGERRGEEQAREDETRGEERRHNKIILNMHSNMLTCLFTLPCVCSVNQHMSDFPEVNPLHCPHADSAAQSTQADSRTCPGR